MWRIYSEKKQRSATSQLHRHDLSCLHKYHYRNNHCIRAETGLFRSALASSHPINTLACLLAQFRFEISLIIFYTKHTRARSINFSAFQFDMVYRRKDHRFALCDDYQPQLTLFHVNVRIYYEWRMACHERCHGFSDNFYPRLLRIHVWSQRYYLPQYNMYDDRNAAIFDASRWITRKDGIS